MVNVAHSRQDYPRFLTVGVPSTYVSVATTPPTTTNGNASKRTPIAVAIARYAFTQSSTLSPARSEAATLFDRHLERGIRLGLDRGTPLLTSISPRTVVALVVAILKIVTTIRFHGELS